MALPLTPRTFWFQVPWHHATKDHWLGHSLSLRIKYKLLIAVWYSCPLGEIQEIQDLQQNKHLVDVAIGQIGVKETIHAYLARWELFAAIQCNAYLEPTLKFLSSLSVSSESSTINKPDTV